MALTRQQFEEKAHNDPYGHMDSDDKEFIADNMEIIPVDANNDNNDLALNMSWGERHLGGGGLMTVTDYGRHRDEVDTLGDFVEFIREEIRDGFPSQYLKVMDDEKETVAEKVLAITRADGYLVVPYFPDD